MHYRDFFFFNFFSSWRRNNIIDEQKHNICPEMHRSVTKVIQAFSMSSEAGDMLQILPSRTKHISQWGKCWWCMKLKARESSLHFLLSSNQIYCNSIKKVDGFAYKNHSYMCNLQRLKEIHTWKKGYKVCKATHQN